MTYRLYIDEVGNSDLKGSATDDNIRYLSLTGIATKRLLHDKKIAPQLDALKASTIGKVTAILHRREIVQRKGIFRALDDHALRRRFDEGLLAFVRTAPYIVNTVVIDKRQHLERYKVWQLDPYHYCLRCLLERYVLRLERIRERGDVIIEERFKKSDRRVKESFKKIFYDGTEHVSAQRFQNALLSHEIKFARKSDNIAAMQLCDLLAHPSYRSMKLEREGQKVPLDFGSSIVDILTEGKYARDPLTKTIPGWGRKWLP